MGDMFEMLQRLNVEVAQAVGTLEGTMRTTRNHTDRIQLLEAAIQKQNRVIKELGEAVQGLLARDEGRLQ